MPAQPSGSILLWYGSIASIPAGYVLCNGANGTPDLRDRFIVGAGSTYAVGANGGAINHNHAFTSNLHFHTIPAAAEIAAGANFDQATSNETASGTTDNSDGRPPYHALAYIMKT